jgi:flap endonuclease-1
LAKRQEKREKAKEEMDQAKEADDEERITQLSKRLIRVGTKENGECKKLLTLMGIPYVEAPCEAEAQCAELCRGGKVYATATEDMDALTFGTPILGRHMTISEARKQPIKEYDLSKVLEGLKLDMDQFIDMCILCGCDYCHSIRGMGPKKALSYIQKFKTIEKVLEEIKGMKQFTIPDEFYEEFDGARKLFKKPNVTPCSEIDLKWKDPDEEGLIQFLVKDNGFEEKKVLTVCERIKKSRKQTNQSRISNFFQVTSPAKKVVKKPEKKETKKRKREDEPNKKNKK